MREDATFVRRALVPCLFLAAVLGGVPAAEVAAQQGIFTAEPTWLSGPANRTNTVVLGDIDGDGDLDLVCGNGNNMLGQFGTLYLNTDGTLETVPSWLSQEFSTRSLALGDVDGDGDLDLVCGNQSVADELYLNVGGGLGEGTIWRGTDEMTYSIALGDVDGDGLLDLVCGTRAAPNMLYLNTGGTFAETPAWTMDARQTVAVDLGDVDGDGDLDLVCGNLAEPSTILLNEGGTFATIPFWASDSTFHTSGVALGDVDGDGRLDLVCANYGDDESNTLYLNSATGFSDQPAWMSAPSESYDVDLGDADGDGDLDAVFASTTGDALYLNEGGIFASSPAWTAPPRAFGTLDVALGDVDGDGMLDLVCGIVIESNVVYRNIAGPFPAEPDWLSGVLRSTTAVATGDIDGDGTVDLVCGNRLERNTLYLNVAGELTESPVWEAATSDWTLDIALRDVDADGDPDLVCGNFQGTNTMYRNDGGTFGVLPAWSSLEMNETAGIDLGDLDGDGDPDLVCADQYEGTRVYRNTGRTFAEAPVWHEASTAYHLVLGDVDRDGDLDLVMGGGYSLRLVLNTGSGLADTTAWSTSLRGGNDIALLDVDGDGYLDLVSANYEQPNTIYYNLGGLFSTTPGLTWGSMTISLATGDLDADGDGDIVCGRVYEDLLYRNLGGALEAPSWSTSLSSRSYDTKLVDVDNDSDLDLVCGKYEENLLYRNVTRPEFKQNPTAPTHHLPNNPAWLSSAEVVEVDENRYRVRFLAADVESDPVRLVLEYQFVDSHVWSPVERFGGDGAAGPFTTSPTGVADSVDWDTHAVPFDSREVVLRARTLETPRRVSRFQTIPTFVTNAGRIVPRRPELTPRPAVLAFDTTVTVGDTLRLDLTIANTGNELLVVTDVDVPSPESRVDCALPLEIPPGDEVPVGVFVEPLTQTEIAGDVTLTCNDPLQPQPRLPLTTNITPLLFDSRLLSPADSIPLGEAVTIIVTPGPEVRVESGHLVHRSSLSGTAFRDSVPLSPSGDEFIAVLPGDAVTEAGLDYFIRVENSGAWATDPPGAPGDFHTQPVEIPTAVTSAPVPTSGGDFLAGRDIIVQVALPRGASFLSGVLHYRRGGETVYRVDSLAIDETGPAAVIPDSMVGPRGVEYWAEVETGTTQGQALTDPPYLPHLRPHFLPVKIRSLAEEVAAPGGVYRMVSVPLNLDTESIENLLSDQAEFGPYDPTRWRLYGYRSEYDDYLELAPDDSSGFFRPRPGRGYWLICRSAHRIDTAPIDGYSVPTDAPCEVELLPGWNQVGNPFPFPVAWDSVRVDGLTAAAAEAASIVEPPVRWTGPEGYVADVEILRPFRGYWLANLTSEAVTLEVSAHGNEPAPVSAGADPPPGPPHWRVGIRAAAAGQTDAANILGVWPGARDGRGPEDRLEPPPCPGPAISLYFPRPEWGGDAERFTVDLRAVHPAPGEAKEPGGHAWTFDVAATADGAAGRAEITLDFTGIGSIPAEQLVRMCDRELGRIVDLRTDPRYVFHPRVAADDGSPARFALLVGNDAFIATRGEDLPGLPSRTALLPNRPNPFNPLTIIRYELAATGPVSLRIYDLRGALVRTLREERQERGRYDAAWDGTDRRGGRVAAGVYFCQLRTGEVTLTRKMTLVK